MKSGNIWQSSGVRCTKVYTVYDKIKPIKKNCASLCKMTEHNLSIF